MSKEEGTPEDCAICKQSLTDANIATSICNHKFHFNCLFKWTKKSNTCPLCRCELVDEDEDEKSSVSSYDSDAKHDLLQVYILHQNVEELDKLTKCYNLEHDEHEMILCDAVGTGNVEIVKCLLNAYPNIYETVHYSLETAAELDNVEIFKLLFERCTPEDHHYKYVIDEVVRNDKINFLEVIYNKISIGKYGIHAVTAAAYYDRLNIIKFLETKGVNINHYQADMWNNLFHGHKKCEVMKFLVEETKDIEPHINKLLIVCIDSDNNEIINYIVKKYPDILKIDKYPEETKETVKACINGNIKLNNLQWIDCLASNGLDISQFDLSILNLIKQNRLDTIKHLVTNNYLKHISEYEINTAFKHKTYGIIKYLAKNKLIVLTEPQKETLKNL